MIAHLPLWSPNTLLICYTKNMPKWLIASILGGVVLLIGLNIFLFTSLQKNGSASINPGTGVSETNPLTSLNNGQFIDGDLKAGWQISQSQNYCPTAYYLVFNDQSKSNPVEVRVQKSEVTAIVQSLTSYVDSSVKIKGEYIKTNSCDGVTPGCPCGNYIKPSEISTIKDNPQTVSISGTISCLNITDEDGVPACFKTLKAGTVYIALEGQVDVNTLNEGDKITVTGTAVKDYSNPQGAVGAITVQSLTKE
jgi:hypothetical protein